MFFCERLNFLLDLFQDTGRSLARVLHVDPSLVNRWQNGHRLPSPKSRYIEDIVNYYGDKDLMDFQLQRLTETIRISLPNCNLETSAKLKKALAEWLLMPEQPAPEKESTPEAQQSSQSAVLDRLTGLKNLPQVMIQEAPRPLAVSGYDPPVGKAFKHELYTGNEGKRQAMMKIFHTALASRQPVELLLTGQDDMTWLVEDAAYLSRWTSIFRENLVRGNRVVMIHKLDRRNSQVVTMLNQWMPLYLAGDFHSWYYPRYDEQPLWVTLYIVREMAVAFSINASRGNPDDYLIFTRDPALIRIMSNLYNSLLADCSPLVNLYRENWAGAFADYINDLYQKAGFTCTLLEAPDAPTIPLSLYKRLLERTRCDEPEKEIRLALHQKRSQSFLNSLRDYTYREFYRLQGFDEILQPPGAFYPGIYFFCDHPVLVRPEEVGEHLSYMVELLNTYENYEVVISNKVDKISGPNKQGLIWKEDESVCFFSWGDTGTRCKAFSTAEETIVRSFERYFSSIWSMVPRSNRSREWTITKLEERINRLKKWSCAL